MSHHDEMAADAAVDDDQTRYIDELRAKLATELSTAETAITVALVVHDELRSDGVHDIEFTAIPGDDIVEHLQAAARSLRAADALRAAAVR